MNTPAAAILRRDHMENPAQESGFAGENHERRLTASSRASKSYILFNFSQMSFIGTLNPVSRYIELCMAKTWTWRWIPTGRVRIIERKRETSPSEVSRKFPESGGIAVSCSYRSCRVVRSKRGGGKSCRQSLAWALSNLASFVRGSHDCSHLPILGRASREIMSHW